MPVGFKFRIGIAVIHLGGELPQVGGNAAKAIAQSVYVIKAPDILSIALGVRWRKVFPLGRRHLLDATEHTGTSLMLLPDVTLGNTAVEHLI